MAVDAFALMENFKRYFEPLSKAAIAVKEQVSGPIVDAYMAGASVVGASAVKPVYVVGVGAVAAGALLFTYYACGASRKTPKASRSRGKKKRNAKRKSVMAKRRSKMNRGVAVENGCAGVGLAAPGVSGSTANDSGERRESGGAPTSAQAVKAAEIPTSSVDQSQGKGEQKGSGTQPAPKEAPPVMTKSLRARKKKAAKAAKEKAAVAAAVAVAMAAIKKEAVEKKGSGATGCPVVDDGVADPWGSQYADGEWETGPMSSQDGEWETVSHKKKKKKKSKPEKEEAVADEVGAISVGGGVEK